MVVQAWVSRRSPSRAKHWLATVAPALCFGDGGDVVARVVGIGLGQLFIPGVRGGGVFGVDLGFRWPAGGRIGRVGQLYAACAGAEDVLQDGAVVVVDGQLQVGVGADLDFNGDGKTDLYGAYP